MNCFECQEYIVAYLEGLLDPQQDRDVAAHLQTCPACKAEVAEHAELRENLVESGKIHARRSLRTSVMDEIVRERTLRLRKKTMRKRYGKVACLLGAAAAIAVVLFVPWGNATTGKATAAEVLAQGAQAWSDLQSVFIGLNVRTVPHDNFECIVLDNPLVEHEMWKESGEPAKYRVEKPGRVVASDGENATLLIGGPGRQSHLGFKGTPDAGYVGWMERLMDVDQVLESELRLAEKYGWDLQLVEEPGPDGTPQLVVTIEAKALGDFTNDWLKNKNLSDSDQRRVYRFDAETKRLEDLEVWVHAEERDVLVLDITKIAHNPVIDPALWTVDVPEDVIWAKEAEVLPDNEKYAQMSPGEAARAFFEALADENWDEALKFYGWSDFAPAVRMMYGGLEIVEIGEPFQSGDYEGWFVPYHVKVNSGWFGGKRLKKWNLALENNNEAGRYIVDGGF